MKRIFSILVLIILPTLIGFGQNNSYQPNYLFTQYYDWGGNDGILSMSRENPNIVISGRTRNNSINNAIVMKTNSEGQRLWTWIGNDDSDIGEISTLPNSTYVFVYTENVTISPQGKIANISQNGELLWDKNINLHDPYLISIDTNNHKLATIEAYSNIVKILDYNGIQIDSAFLNTNSSLNLHLYFSDNTLLISGNASGGVNWNHDGFMAKFAKSNGIWEKVWQHQVIDGFWANFTVDNSGYIYLGLSQFYQTYSTYLMKKLDSNGIIIWEKEWTPTHQQLLNAIHSVIQLPDNKGILFVGRLFSTSNTYNGIMLAYDLDGNFLFQTENPENEMMEYKRAKFDQQKRLILTGEKYSFNTNSKDAFLQFWSIEGITSVEPIPSPLPSDYALSQNYPNPFNPATTIRYQIPYLSFVLVKVYDVLGNEITTLVNEEKPEGSYKVEFDGSELRSGIYFYRLQAGSFIETKKMVLIR